ncbi:MAG: hypothetical protein COA73_03155 [Candidatus Hydrogenedentota bacterium]|nr:MAG: hypothetical protein COA73_03155 [Candidatus Hydrogenedentota bacterium]
MNSKIIMAVVLCVMLCVAMGAMSTEAFAQDSNATKAVDKDLANKRGISASLASGADDEESDGPTKMQMGLGVGSIFVMIIVVKWL